MRCKKLQFYSASYISFKYNLNNMLLLGYRTPAIKIQRSSIPLFTRDNFAKSRHPSQRIRFHENKIMNQQNSPLLHNVLLCM